jgi:hypothetical protein
VHIVQNNIDVLQTHKKLLNDELQLPRHEPILLQHIPLFGLIVVESDHKGTEHHPTMN